MKKFKFNKGVIEDLLKNDNALKIASLTLAVILFISINQIGNPLWKDFFTTSEYINNVPVQMDYDKEKYVVSGLPSSIPVTMSGSESNVTSEMRRQDSIYGVLALSSRGPGEYVIDSSEIEFNTQTNVRMEPAVGEFKIKIQQKVEKEVPVSVSYINGQGASAGYILKTPTLSQSNVKITGGNEDVESVVSVMGFVDLSQMVITEGEHKQTFEVTLVPYDAKGSVVPNVVLSPNKITVTQEYEVSTVELPVTYEYINNNTGKYVSSICDVRSTTNCSDTAQTTVKVYGDSAKISSIDSIKYKVDLKGFKGDKGEVVGTPFLDSGVYILGDYEKTYNIELENGITRTFDEVPFRVENLDPTLQAKTITGELPYVSVTVTGAKSVVNNLTKEDIILTLDLSEVNKPGKYSFPIKVRTNGDYDYKLSKDRMQIEVWEI